MESRVRKSFLCLSVAFSEVPGLEFVELRAVVVRGVAARSPSLFRRRRSEGGRSVAVVFDSRWSSSSEASPFARRLFFVVPGVAVRESRGSRRRLFVRSRSFRTIIEF